MADSASNRTGIGASRRAVVEERAAVKGDPLNVVNLLLRETGIHLLGQGEDVGCCLGFDCKPNALSLEERIPRWPQQSKRPILENDFQRLCNTSLSPHHALDGLYNSLRARSVGPAVQPRNGLRRKIGYLDLLCGEWPDDPCISRRAERSGARRCLILDVDRLRAPHRSLTSTTSWQSRASKEPAPARPGYC